jgi:hypothetical protein
MSGRVASIARWSPHSTTCLTASDYRFSYQLVTAKNELLNHLGDPLDTESGAELESDMSGKGCWWKRRR